LTATTSRVVEHWATAVDEARAARGRFGSEFEFGLNLIVRALTRSIRTTAAITQTRSRPFGHRAEQTCRCVAASGSFKWVVFVNGNRKLISCRQLKFDQFRVH
jgi:hypothetical protein